MTADLQRSSIKEAVSRADRAFAKLSPADRLRHIWALSDEMDFEGMIPYRLPDGWSQAISEHHSSGRSGGGQGNRRDRSLSSGSTDLGFLLGSGSGEKSLVTSIEDPNEITREKSGGKGTASRTPGGVLSSSNYGRSGSGSGPRDSGTVIPSNN